MAGKAEQRDVHNPDYVNVLVHGSDSDPPKFFRVFKDSSWVGTISLEQAIELKLRNTFGSPTLWTLEYSIENGRVPHQPNWHARVIDAVKEQNRFIRAHFKDYPEFWIVHVRAVAPSGRVLPFQIQDDAKTEVESSSAQTIKSALIASEGNPKAAAALILNNV